MLLLSFHYLIFIIIFRIFKEIYSKAPLILRDLSDESVDLDYKECTNNHIDFKKSMYIVT